MLKITHKTRIMHNAVDLLTKKIDIIQKGNWKENVIMHDTRILQRKRLVHTLVAERNNYRPRHQTCQRIPPQNLMDLLQKY